MNYNTDVDMWRNQREGLNGWGKLSEAIVVIDGHFFTNKGGAVARFDDDASAVKVLQEAGFTETKEGWI